MMPEILRIGLDIGSTTIKCVVLDEADKIIYSCYERHLSLIAQKTRELLTRLDNEVVHGAPVRLSISGSAGMGLALGSHISFVQEVYATKVAADMLMPGTDVIIELGGEDAKILFLQGTLEVRMNGSCAGGTGAFIDQMATLLGVTPTEMNEEAKKAQRTYTIASRCGVFAKTDVQPLLNQGAVYIGIDNVCGREQNTGVHWYLIEQTEIGIENSSDAEKQQGDDGRNEARQCDFRNLLPFACAVQSGSLIEGRIDTDQRCNVDQASVSYALPAVRDDQDRRPVFRFLVPLNRVNVEQRKDRVVDKTIFCTQKRIYDVA